MLEGTWTDLPIFWQDGVSADKLGAHIRMFAAQMLNAFAAVRAWHPNVEFFYPKEGSWVYTNEVEVEEATRPLITDRKVQVTGVAFPGLRQVTTDRVNFACKPSVYVKERDVPAAVAATPGEPTEDEEDKKVEVEPSKRQMPRTGSASGGPQESKDDKKEGPPPEGPPVTEGKSKGKSRVIEVPPDDDPSPASDPPSPTQSARGRTSSPVPYTSDAARGMERAAERFPGTAVDEASSSDGDE